MSPGPPQGGSGEGTEHCMCALKKVCRGNDGENGGKIVKTSDFYFDLPQELIAQDGIYRRIYEIQMSHDDRREVAQENGSL